MKRGVPIPYSADELEWIKAHSVDPRPAALAEFCRKFKRSDVSQQNFNALCKRNGWLTGRTGRFEKGIVPANKGKRCAPGKGGRHRNAQATQFRKGNLPHNTKYLGHERISKDGYVEISIDEPNPHTNFERRYVLKHRWLWEQQNGPIPEGHFLKCRDGNRQNCDPSNWECLSRSVQFYLQPHRGHDYEHADEAVKPSIIAVAKLKDAVRKAGA
jgi:hypothetical protein